MGAFDEFTYGPVNAAMVCPHCQTRGQVRAKAVKRMLRGNRPLEIQGVGGYNPHTRKYGR